MDKKVIFQSFQTELHRDGGWPVYVCSVLSAFHSIAATDAKHSKASHCENQSRRRRCKTRGHARVKKLSLGHDGQPRIQIRASNVPVQKFHSNTEKYTYVQYVNHTQFGQHHRMSPQSIFMKSIFNICAYTCSSIA